VEKTVARHRGCWAPPTETSPAVEPGLERGVEPGVEPGVDRGAAPDPQQLAERAAATRREASALVTRTRERYAAVQNLREQGKGIKTIMRELGLAKQTVRRFARAATVEELLATARDGRASGSRLGRRDRAALRVPRAGSGCACPW